MFYSNLPQQKGAKNDFNKEKKKREGILRANVNGEDRFQGEAGFRGSGTMGSTIM